MKNLKAKAIMAKNKLDEMPTKAKVAGSVLIVACAAYNKWILRYMP